jgi:predicted nucleic acid-binding protein
MIVVDTNVMAHLLIPGQCTESAKKLFLLDPKWVTSPLWPSEIRNVLLKFTSMI